MKSSWIQACDDGDLTRMKQMVRNRQNVNEKGPENRTAIMFAGVTGNLEMAKFLVDNGANLFKRDKRGRTALMYARKMNKHEVADFLEECENRKRLFLLKPFNSLRKYLSQL